MTEQERTREERPALIWGVLLDGRGGAREVDWDGAGAWTPAEGVLWLHLDHAQPEAQRWIREEAGLDPIIAAALLADDPRPRSVAANDGRLIILRGVNLNPGANPEDMVSVRMWIDAGRVLTVRQRRVMAVRDVRERLDATTGPRVPGEFLAMLAEYLLQRMGPILNGLEDQMDDLEERVAAGKTDGLHTPLSVLRRQAVMLRRHLAPQREALALLSQEPVPWLTDAHRVSLREVANRLMRYVENLDELRERGAVTQEELHSQMAARLNRNMYALSLVAAIFLPLTLLTGLLGINVAGIPGAESPAAFLAVCGLLVLLAGFQIWLFRRLDWL